MKDFSVVIPLYKSEKFIEPLFSVLNTYFVSSGKSFEIIYVDDCSPDKSYQIVQVLKQQHSSVSLLKMRKNGGQYRATICGMLQSEGDFIITLDADCAISESAMSQWISSISPEDELWYAEFTDKNRNILRAVGARIFDRIVKISAGADEAIAGHSGSSSRIVKGDFARTTLKSIHYPILLDVALISQAKSKIKFYEVADDVSNDSHLSSYEISSLLGMGFYLLFSVIADKLYSRPYANQDFFTEQ